MSQAICGSVAMPIALLNFLYCSGRSTSLATPLMVTMWFGRQIASSRSLSPNPLKLMFWNIFIQSNSLPQKRSGSVLVRGFSALFISDQLRFSFLVLSSSLPCGINRRQSECMAPRSSRSFELYIGIENIRSVAEYRQNAIIHIELVLIIG